METKLTILKKKKKKHNHARIVSFKTAQMPGHIKTIIKLVLSLILSENEFQNLYAVTLNNFLNIIFDNITQSYVLKMIVTLRISRIDV